MKKIKSVIFDLDGTLLDTLTDLTYGVNLTMDKYGVPRRTEEEVRSFVGNGIYKLIERAMPKETSADIIADATEYDRQVYFENMTRTTAPFEGINEMLSELKKRGIKTAVVSNKYIKMTRGLCEKFFPTLDAVVGEDEKNGIMRKPKPDMVLYAMEKLESDREETLYVGDSGVDIETAKNSGIGCISVTWGFWSRKRLADAGATMLADTPGDILKFVR